MMAAQAESASGNLVESLRLYERCVGLGGDSKLLGAKAAVRQGGGGVSDIAPRN